MKIKSKTEQVLEQGANIAAEEARLDKMEADARAGLIAVTDEDITTPSAQKKIADFKLALDLVAFKRAKLRAPLGAVRKALDDLFKAEAAGWNIRVGEARTREIEDFIKANLPYYENDERKCRRELEGERFETLPCAHKWRRAFFHMPFSTNPKDLDLIRDVKILMGHMERQSKALGWE